jgi:predicted kinase
MRALFILRGCSGSGKSTLLRRLGVSDLALGFDQFRHLFSAQFPCLNDDGTPGTTCRLAPATEEAAVKATFAALDARLDAGTTVFFDSTALSAKDQRRLADRARRYGYTSYVIDCQGDTGFDTVTERNAARVDGSRVPDADLRAMWERGRARSFADGIEVIDGTDLDGVRKRLMEIAEVTKVRAERVIVVGDVHSCAAGLDTAVAELDTPDTRWVFVGDLFDRGPDPVGVWGTVHALGDRASFVTGNHEGNLRRVNNHTSTQRYRDTRATRDALLAAGIMAAEQTAFVDAGEPAVWIRVPGQRPHLVTHAGVSPDTLRKMRQSRFGLLHISEAACIYGMGTREQTYRGKSTYAVDQLPLAGEQFHGHRNGPIGGEPVAPVRAGSGAGDVPGRNVYCLESGVASSDGHGVLTVAVMTSGGIDLRTFDDGCTATTAAAPVVSDTQIPLLDRMRTSDLVTVRPAGDDPHLAGVLACNFTRDAFRNSAWDGVSVHARGLFIDEASGKVVARGYEKFFHLDEDPGRTRDQWLDTSVTAYPVTLRKKFNGYLALVASINGHLTVMSKAGRTDYARFAEKMLARTLPAEKREQLRGMLERTDTTAAFEVLSSHDPHPVNEPGHDRLVLLYMIRNAETFATVDKVRDGIAARFGFDTPEAKGVYTGGTPGLLSLALEASAQRPDEGVVLVDARGYRSKVKADDYAARKAARGQLERVWRGKTDTLGQRGLELERRLRDAGIWGKIAAGDFTVTGVDGSPKFDLASLFDSLDSIEGRGR